MSQRQFQSVSVRQVEKKNQKNIYVHKINSLIKISQQNLLEDEREISNALTKKKIKKVRSEIDKNALKLEKNRESAKRARLRKKLYIKLLESQVERLKEVAKEGERIERESQKFLKMVARKEEVNDLMLDEVERYLSRDNLNDSKKAEQEREDAPARMDKLVEEICQVSMCSSLRNIRELSSQISLEEILRADTPAQKLVEGEELQEIIKQVLMESEELRKIYMQIVRENENVKKLMEEQELKREEFAEDFHIYADSNEIKVEEPANAIIPEEEFCSYVRRPKETCNFFINLTEAERVLIQASSFLELNANLDQM